jgi:hypothetical protein
MNANGDWNSIADRLWERMEGALRNRQFKRLHQRFSEEIEMSPEESYEFFRWIYDNRVCSSESSKIRRKPTQYVQPDAPTKARPTGSPVSVRKEEGQSIEISEAEGSLDISSKGHSIRTLEELVAAAEIDLIKWTVLEWGANTWESFYRTETGHNKVQMWQVKARLAPSVFSEIRPAKVDKPLPVTKRVQHKGKVRTCVVVPDTQHGFRWNENRTKLIPMHDRRAIDCVVQLIERLKPELIVHLGDGPDFAEWSTKYPREPALIETTQPAIEELHYDLRRMKDASIDSRFIYLEGNHCFRIRSALIEKLPVALSTKAVGDKREALHLARLLSLDDLGIEYFGPYGSHDDDWYWDDRVRFVHDGGVKSRGGQTVAAHVEHAECTTVFGHVHRLELAGKTTHRGSRIRTIYAASAGCLCRIDGAVPGATGRPDWQHGCVVVSMTDKNEYVQLVPIHDGSMIWNSDLIVGVDHGAEIARAINRPVG